MRASLVLLAALALARPGGAAHAGQSDPALATGTRQVEEGDFEGAIATLEPVVLRLAAAGGAPAAQACLQLGIARLALGERDAALARFREALVHQPTLRLAADQYSPKVLSAFEEARRAREAEARATARAGPAKEPGKGHAGRTVLLAGGAVAAGVAVALAVGGADGASSGGLTLTGARFGTPVLDCPNGATATPLAVAVDLNAQNATGGDVTLSASSAVLFIVTSPGVPGEVGFASTAPATVVPATLHGGTTALRVQTTLNCANGTGDAPRFNEWRGRVTLAGGGTAQTIETADTMRVNLP